MMADPATEILITVQKRHHAQNDEHDENHILLFHETPTFNLQC